MFFRGNLSFSVLYSSHMNFLETLVHKGIIQRSQLDEIISRSTKEDISIEKILLEMGVPNDEIRRAKSEYYDVPMKEIDYDKVDPEIVRIIPKESAKIYKMVPIGKTEDGLLEVGMVDPRNIESQNVLQFITAETNTPYKIYVLTEEDFEKVFKKYKDMNNEISEALDDFTEEGNSEVANLDDLGGGTREEKSTSGETIIHEDAPITKMVASIVKKAVRGGVSDIHMDPTEKVIKVRFRIDGELQTYFEVPKSAHSAMVARIKIMTKTMKLDEKRKPQDGRFQAIIDGRKIAFRVSIMPTFYGEKVVIRILDAEKGIRKLSSLGLNEEQEAMVREAISRPHGLILITGPTGSGKTTTLYSMLGEVDREHKNVVSLEDPIEYQFPGVNQSQVRADIGYTFASGLRAIVRQDPDVIMVGEIRDKETANLAIQAALTGHLVFATLHTNSSFGIIPRLVDMGVDEYLIAPTLILGVAQRLLKKIAPGAKVQLDEVEMESARRMIEKQFADLPKEHKEKLHLERPLYEAKPTKEFPTGMKGREAILEMFAVDKTMERIILENPTELAIYSEARKKGMITLREAGILKCMEGIVPFREVNNL